MTLLRTPTTTVAALTALATAGALAVPLGGVAAVDRPARRDVSSTVLLDWERSAIRTIYTETPTPVPVGVPYLGFTSLAMYDAARTADRRHASAEAAVAAAAHDVLVEYFPVSTANLDADLAASLLDVPDGPAERRGIRIGEDVAARLIERRADDGRNDASIVYSKPVAPGTWQPPAGGTMLGAWIGFVDPLLVRRPTRVDGPDALTSRQYTRDYLEVKAVGSAVGADRTPYQTETALFMNSNAPRLTTEALLGHLDAAPRPLLETARIFAAMHVAMTDSLIQAWRLKYDVGFWRPSQAIQGAATDGNPGTIADPAWTPLVANPPYADYTSGHASVTAPAAEVIRQLLGEETALTLHSYNTNTDRTYPNLSALEYDAFMARIWSGLHFRAAMEDGYEIGHDVADQVLRRLP
jgi:hypothetical protein